MMITAEVLTYMVRSGTAARKVTGTSRFTDKGVKKITTKWAKNLIEKYFPEFVIDGSLIIFYRTQTGYAAARSCTRQEVSSGFCFKYLEIMAEEEQTAAA
jgi:hypothetical protein